ncbi:MAG: hypothetical protein Tsb0027_13940 [Wenzhouxiangellaceae bacterium]
MLTLAKALLALNVEYGADVHVQMLLKLLITIEKLFTQPDRKTFSDGALAAAHRPDEDQVLIGKKRLFQAVHCID